MTATETLDTRAGRGESDRTMNKPPIAEMNSSSWPTERTGKSWQSAAGKVDGGGVQLGVLINAFGTQYTMSFGQKGTTADNEWDLAGASGGAIPVPYMTQATATHLLNGTVQSDGSITYSGSNKKVGAAYENSLFIVKLV
jgi:hypothetical protein